MAMGIKNKYVLGAHLSERKFRELLRLFAADVPALATADLTGLDRNTVNRYFRLFRERIAEICERQSPFQGEVELDESSFGARRAGGQAGPGSLRQDDRVWAVETGRHGVHPNSAGRFQEDVAGGGGAASGLGIHRVHGRLFLV